MFKRFERTMKPTRMSVALAREHPRAGLVGAFDHEPPGISGHGAGLGYGSGGLGLNVTHDDADTVRFVEHRLPCGIGGLRVHASKRGPSVLD